MPNSSFLRTSIWIGLESLQAEDGDVLVWSSQGHTRPQEEASPTLPSEVLQVRGLQALEHNSSTLRIS